MRLDTIVAVKNRAGKSFTHTHDMWEIIVACGGEGFVVVEEKKHAFRRGTVICVPPNTLHYNVSDDTYSHIAIIINNFISTWGERSATFYDDEENTFEALAQIALRIFYTNDTGREMILASFCDVLYGIVVSKIGSEMKNADVETVKNKMIANFTAPEFCASDAFDSMNYSEGHFRKLFRQQMGMTPVEYLTRLRLEYAKKLLSDGKGCGGKISHAALRAGFYDSRYFSRLFKEHYALTPREYIISSIKDLSQKE